MKYTRFYADPDGETHLEEIEVETQQVELAPTAIFGVTKEMLASSVFFADVPSGYSDEYHPPPARYL